MKKKYVLKSKAKFITFVSITIIILFTTFLSSTVYSYKQQSYQIITVRSGDTLWDISKKYNNQKDTRKCVYEIKKINNLETSEIFVGTQIKVPLK